jgi:hypothetical protein
MGAIAAGEMSVLEALHAGLNEAVILVGTRASNTPIGYRLQGMIEVLGGMAGTMLRKHRLDALSSAGPAALALTVLKEIDRSGDPLSDNAIAHALGVRTSDLTPTLAGLQASGLVRVPSS